MSSSTFRRELILIADASNSLPSDLAKLGFGVSVVQDCAGALQAIAGRAFDALLITVSCEDRTGFLRRLQLTDAALQVLIFTDSELPPWVNQNIGVDIVSTAEPLERLRPMIFRAVELTRLRRDNSRLRQQLAALSSATALRRDASLPPTAGRLELTIGGEADLASISRAHVIAVLAQNNGNKARTARALGINRRSLYRLLEKYQS